MGLKQAGNWLEQRSEINSVRAAVCDLNGILRGKRLPRDLAKKALAGEMKLPLSTLSVDVWGGDVLDSEAVLDSGDKDGVCLPTERGFLAIDWLEQPTAILPVSLYENENTPYMGDPRHVLAAILARFKSLGLTPVCATELEFYLFDPNAKPIGAPTPLGSKKPMSTNAIYSVEDIDNFDVFLSDVYAACEAMDIPAEAAISENGCGQFEINLHHVPDALKAADDAIFFKYLVKGIAKKHGYGASFMAKPYGEESGSGLHVHFSILDESGANVFNNGTFEGSDVLQHAIGGLLAAMPECMLIFAPHLNSYRRLRSGSHAPVNVAWGYENRTTALRVPDSPNVARRIEHRVAGADANPYLVLSAILGAAFNGIENKLEAGEPLPGNAYESDCPRLPTTWSDAIATFENGQAVTKIFGETLPKRLLETKTQELNTFATQVTAFEYDSYLNVV